MTWEVVNLPGHSLLTVGDVKDGERVWHAECRCGWVSEQRRIPHEPAGLWLDHINDPEVEPIVRPEQMTFGIQIAEVFNTRPRRTETLALKGDLL